MALPTSVLGQLAADANEIFAGTVSDVWLVEGEILIPATPSYFPTHGLSLQGIPATAKAYSSKFSGGVTAVAAVKTVTVVDYSLLDTGVDTLTVGGKVYTFVSGAPTGDQIQFQTSNTVTATNIAAKITADTSTTLATATSASAVVTITANTAGTDFTLSTNADAGELTVAVVTANVAAVAATATITSAGTRFTAKTISEIAIPMTVGTTNPKVERIRFQYETPTSATNTIVAAGLDACLTAALDNTGSTGTSGGGKYRYFSTNLQNTNAEIQTALQNLFGVTSSAAFSSSGATLTLTLGTVGADGNNVGIGVVIRNSSPTPLLTVSSDGVPQVAGVPIHLGAQDAFQAAVNPQTQDVLASNFKNRFARITTGQTLDISFKLFQDDNIDLATYGLNSAALTHDDTSNVMLFAGLSLPAKFGLIFVSPSKRVGGDYDVLVIYSVESSALTINRAKNTVNGFDFRLAPNAFNRQGDPVGYIKQPRQL